jgi:predicted CxxxxCH...CXXCH cytochrome family protein
VNKDGLPLRGKLQKPTPPAGAVFGMIYRNTTDGREYIYDGAQWVPHDSTAENFYKTKSSGRTAALSTTSLNGGAHDRHAVYGCEDCHRVDWANGLELVWFDKPNSPAIGSGMPAPLLDPATSTCSNIACHGIQNGMTFSYYFPDGSGEPVLKTINTNGNPPATTPNWYSSAALGCDACHGNPPLNGSSGSNVWHSGYHGNQDPTGAYNQCQLCHPDASSPGNGIGGTTTDPFLHANGVINVQAMFKAACFNCH